MYNSISIQRMNVYLITSLWILLIVAVTISSAASPGKFEPLSVEIQTVDVDQQPGQLVSLSITHGATVIFEGKEKVIPVVDLVRISTSIQSTNDKSRDTLITLTCGDHMRGRLIRGNHESISLETSDLGTIIIPLDALSRIDAAQAFKPAYRESAKWLVRSRRVGEDQVLLTNGDVLSGFITSVDSQMVTIEGEMGESQIPLHVVVSAQFASPPPNSSDRVMFIVTLQNTGRVTMSAFEWTGRKVNAKLMQGPKVQIDTKYIVRICVEGGRWSWLTSLVPSHYEFTPMVSVRWPYKTNQNVLGEAMTVSGQTFEHGVGVHSRSILTYDLKGKFRLFITSFGMDDHSGPFADVTVRIQVDGQTRFEKKHVRRGKLHETVRLDVEGAEKIELVVDFGDNGDLQDRFNWINTALVR